MNDNTPYRLIFRAQIPLQTSLPPVTLVTERIKSTVLVINSVLMYVLYILLAFVFNGEFLYMYLIYKAEEYVCLKAVISETARPNLITFLYWIVHLSGKAIGYITSCHCQ